MFKIFITQIFEPFSTRKERVRGLLRNVDIRLILFVVLDVVDYYIKISIWIFKFRYCFIHLGIFQG